MAGLITLVKVVLGRGLQPVYRRWITGTAEARCPIKSWVIQGVSRLLESWEPTRNLESDLSCFRCLSPGGGLLLLLPTFADLEQSLLETCAQTSLLVAERMEKREQHDAFGSSWGFDNAVRDSSEFDRRLG